MLPIFIVRFTKEEHFFITDIVQKSPRAFFCRNLISFSYEIFGIFLTLEKCSYVHSLGLVMCVIMKHPFIDLYNIFCSCLDTFKARFKMLSRWFLRYSTFHNFLPLFVVLSKTVGNYATDCSHVRCSK